MFVEMEFNLNKNWLFNLKLQAVSA